MSSTKGGGIGLAELEYYFSGSFRRVYFLIQGWVKDVMRICVSMSGMGVAEGGASLVELGVSRT